MSDFSQPGSDGVLPDGFQEWQWDVIPLVRGREYRIVASVRRRIAKDEEFTAYEELYRRAAWAARALIGEVTCSAEGEPLHTWIGSQGWGCFGEGHRAAFAGVGLGLIFPNPA